jgi:hypothetical protein
MRAKRDFEYSQDLEQRWDQHDAEARQAHLDEETRAIQAEQERLTQERAEHAAAEQERLRRQLEVGRQREREELFRGVLDSTLAYVQGASDMLSVAAKSLLDQHRAIADRPGADDTDRIQQELSLRERYQAALLAEREHSINTLTTFRER